MTEDQVAKVLLVRAVEESGANLFRHEELQRAHAQAGHEFGQQNWFLSRATYLIGLLPTSYLSILEMAKLPGHWLPGILALACLSGMAANYLGPPGRIHVLLNPIMLLAGWNLCVYAAMAVRTLAARHQRATQAATAGTAPERGADSLPWSLKSVLPGIWKLGHALGIAAPGEGSRTTYARVVARFWTLWAEVAGQTMLAEWRRMRHLMAVALALGAIAGIYVRGLFFEYNVIWTSTFIRSEETVTRLMGWLLAPALRIEQLFGGEPNLALLAGPQGAPAAAWIHAYAITAVIFVVVPRGALAAWEGHRADLGHEMLTLRFDAYYTERVEPQLRAMIEHEVRSAIAACAGRVSAFAAEHLYQGRVVPELNRFRSEGGRISDLKRAIEARCTEFQPELNTKIEEALRGLETDLAANIAQVVKNLQPDLPLDDLSRGVSMVRQTDQIAATIAPVGRSFADAINTLVSLSIATTAATISGGFGESLGIAVLVELTAVSGPVGFLIGGLTALVVSAAGLWLGREKITGAIESISIPGFALRGVLWSSRYEKLLAEGGTRTRASVEKQMEELMAPLAPQMADGIWRDIESAWHGVERADR